LGSHYRNEWSTPVRSKFWKGLDAAFGDCLTLAHWRDSKSHTLRLEDKKESSMFLRSIDKTFTKTLPGFDTLLFESLLTTSFYCHPILAQPYLHPTEQQKYFMQDPQIVFLPKQKSLGEQEDL